MRAELVDRYGPVPLAVERLFALARVRAAGRALGLEEIVQQGKYLRLAPVDLTESVQLRLKRLYPGTIWKPATRTALVSVPRAEGLGAGTVVDEELLAWLQTVLGALKAA